MAVVASCYYCSGCTAAQLFLLLLLVVVLLIMLHIEKEAIIRTMGTLIALCTYVLYDFLPVLVSHMLVFVRVSRNI